MQVSICWNCSVQVTERSCLAVADDLSFALHDLLGSDGSRLCHLQLPGYRHLPSRGEGRETVEGWTGGFCKPALDVGHFTSPMFYGYN